MHSRLGGGKTETYDTVDQAVARLADVARRRERHGYEPASGAGERPDAGPVAGSD